MRKSIKPNFEDFNSIVEFEQTYHQILKEELLFVAREVEALFIKYELSQQEACYVALRIINNMAEITKPLYATIKLHSLND